MDKRTLLVLLLVSCASVPKGKAPVLTVSPSPAYKAADVTKEDTESCTFNAVVKADEAITIEGATITLFAGTRELETRTLTAEGARGVDLLRDAGNRRALRLVLRRPSADAFDRARVVVETRTAKGARSSAAVEIPVTAYVQKTKLIFPFRGRGLVVSGGVNDGGHRNGSGQFALDVLALSKDYAPIVCPEDVNECAVEYGAREIIAPADGTVVHAWNDFADNVEWGSADKKRFTLPDGTVIESGNSVILDHGNGEFSMLSHMKQGSIVVKDGDQVKQGQKIGLLGNSGESYGPHLHYQLQNGPDPLKATGLPPTFGNTQRLTRGTYFNAK